MSEGCLFLISAPSGAGKTSLVKAATDSNPTLTVSVSHTTRAKRPGELDGRNYHFVSEDTFRQMISADAFLEHATVFGNLYGTHRTQVEEKLQQGLDVILEIDWQGAAQVRQHMPQAVSIFILPPSEATLEQRLKARDSDDADTIAKRLSEARLDMSKAADFDFIVINDDFDRATQEILAIFASAKLTKSHQLKHNGRVKALVPVPIDEGPIV